MCTFFVREYHDFLIYFDASQCRRDCRIHGSAFAAIGRRWKTDQSENLQTHSDPQEIVSKHFFVQKKALKLFTVNASCQLPSVNFYMSLRQTVTLR